MTTVPPARRLRIALLRSDDAHHGYLEARLAGAFELVGVVVESGRDQRSRLGRLGRRRALAWRRYHALRQRLTGRAGYARRFFDRPGSPASAPVAQRRLDAGWINADEVPIALERWRPDVTVVCGTSIIGRRTLAAAGLAINVHGGYLPWYRGNHGVFFAYERGDFSRVGASLHLVTADLDRGDLLAVVRPEVFPHDDDGHLYCRSVQLAIDHLVDLLADVEAGRPLCPVPLPDGGETFRHRDRTPLREARLWFRRRTGRHEVPHLPPEVTDPGPTRRGEPPRHADRP